MQSISSKIYPQSANLRAISSLIQSGGKAFTKIGDFMN